MTTPRVIPVVQPPAPTAVCGIHQAVPQDVIRGTLMGAGVETESATGAKQRAHVTTTVVRAPTVAMATVTAERTPQTVPQTVVPHTSAEMAIAIRVKIRLVVRVTVVHPTIVVTDHVIQEKTLPTVHPTVARLSHPETIREVKSRVSALRARTIPSCFSQQPTKHSCR